MRMMMFNMLVLVVTLLVAIGTILGLTALESEEVWQTLTRKNILLPH